MNTTSPVSNRREACGRLVSVKGIDSLGLKNIIFELDANKLVDNLNVSIKLASKFSFSYNIVWIYLGLGQIVWLNM